MSRLKGFAACDSVSPTPALSPALQLLCKEHAKLRKSLEEIHKFASRNVPRTREWITEWLFREKRLRVAWNAHTAKEERHLLAVLSKYVDSDRGPLAVMKYEHERLDAMFDEWEASLAQLQASPEDEKLYQDVLGKFRMACQMKGDHCYKEEKAIYGLAQSLLSDAEKVMLLQQFRKMKL